MQNKNYAEENKELIIAKASEAAIEAAKADKIDIELNALLESTEEAFEEA